MCAAALRTGLFFTIRTRGVQFRCFGEGWKKMFGGFSLSGGDHGGHMSSFQALATAVADFVAAEGDAIVEGYTLDAAGNLVDKSGEAVLTNDDMSDPAKLAGAIGISKTNMAQLAFGTFFTTGFGNIFVATCLLFFAFSTILSWNLFAKLNVRYLFRNGNTKVAVLVFSVIGIAFVFLGSVLQNDLVWELQDMFNQLMVIPNVIGLIALSGWVVRCSLARGKGCGGDQMDEVGLLKSESPISDK